MTERPRSPEPVDLRRAGLRPVMPEFVRPLYSEVYTLRGSPFADEGEMDRRQADEADDDQTGLFVIALVVVSFIGLAIGFIAGIAVGGGLS